MRFSRKIEGITRRHKIKDKTVREKLQIKPVTEILEKKQLDDWVNYTESERKIARQESKAKTKYET